MKERVPSGQERPYDRTSGSRVRGIAPLVLQGHRRPHVHQRLGTVGQKLLVAKGHGESISVAPGPASAQIQVSHGVADHQAETDSEQVRMRVKIQHGSSGDI